MIHENSCMYMYMYLLHMHTMGTSLHVYEHVGTCVVAGDVAKGPGGRLLHSRVKLLQTHGQGIQRSTTQYTYGISGTVMAICTYIHVHVHL